MEPVISLAIVFVILAAVYYIVTSVALFEPFRRIAQVVVGAIAIIILLNFLRDFI